jgi:hypothetical protein
MGDSTAVTEPLCPERPERGSGTACVVCDMLDCDLMKRVPMQRIAPVTAIRRIGAVFVFR